MSFSLFSAIPDPKPPSAYADRSMTGYPIVSAASHATSTCKEWVRDALFLPAATKLGQGNVFTSVCLSTGGRGVCLSACWDTPPTRHPPGPGTPPREADCSIRLTSGRYASYWNAFLLLTVFEKDLGYQPRWICENQIPIWLRYLGPISHQFLLVCLQKSVDLPSPSPTLSEFPTLSHHTFAKFPSDKAPLL